MNPEIYTIIEDMKKFNKNDPIDDLRIHIHLSIQTARLRVLLAEEAEKQNTKLSDQTDKLIQYTGAIKTLTLVLLFVGIVQIVLVAINFLHFF